MYTLCTSFNTPYYIDKNNKNNIKFLARKRISKKTYTRTQNLESRITALFRAYTSLYTYVHNVYYGYLLIGEICGRILTK